MYSFCVRNVQLLAKCEWQMSESYTRLSMNKDLLFALWANPNLSIDLFLYVCVYSNVRKLHW